MLIWLAFACSDPDFGHLKIALDAYDEGRAAMATGAPEVAVEAFERAVAADPESPTLAAWEARALREAGRESEALTRLSAGLKRFPNSSAIRYDRAALRARAGDVSGASDDLRWLYANEAANPVQVGEDPDFASLQADASARLLVPSAQVEASVTAASSSVLVGDRFGLDFTIVSRTGAPVLVRPASEDGTALKVVRIVEDVTDVGPVWTKRTLRVEALATDSGRLILGPWLVESARTTALTERVLLDGVSIDGRTPVSSPSSAMQIVVPSSALEGGDLPKVVSILGHRWAMVTPEQRPVDSEVMTGIRIDYRERGQPVWSALALKPEADLDVYSDGQILRVRD